MDNSKNFVLAITLSALIILGWQYFFTPKNTQPVNKTSNLEITESLDNIENSENYFINRDNALNDSNSPRIKISSSKVSGSISLKGARFDDLTLNEYKIESKDDSPKFKLLNPSKTPNAYFATFGWTTTNSEIQMPNESTIWQADKSTLEESGEVNLFWTNPQGIKFAINIKLDENYMFSVTQFIENISANDLVISPYGLISRLHNLEDTSDFAILHEGPIGVFNDTLEEVSYEKLEKEKNFKNAKNGWLGISDKYWLTAMIPDKFRTYKARFMRQKSGDLDRFQVDYLGAPIVVNSGTTVKLKSEFYAGAKKLKILDNYADSHDIHLFDRAVDFGWLYMITKPLFYVLQWSNLITGNFGLAIILVTILIKLAMFPIANKSYKSMNAMKKIQPELAKLKETYGKEPMTLNQKVMELYKKEKVNPLSGCLPILIQIPVFFALYKVIFITIEMRHAPFYGWIEDLSMRDPTSIWNLFGVLPFASPSFLPAIGLWPIIMTITMFLQQRMNPAPADPVQAQVMKFLPVMFLFMFFQFPSGLVIYWAWNNLLSIVQQATLIRNSK